MDSCTSQKEGKAGPTGSASLKGSPLFFLAVGIVLFSEGFRRQSPSTPIRQASAQTAHPATVGLRITNRTNHTTAHP